eukprot:s62_g19.t1
MCKKVQTHWLCSQPLALCNQLCMKRHERCSHLCEKNCHEGSCGQCEAKVQRECRCSRTRREVVCSEVGDVTCHQVCRTKKTCGRTGNKLPFFISFNLSVLKRGAGSDRMAMS